MKRGLLLCVVMAGMLVLASSAAFAASEITVTVTLQQIGVSVSPTPWALGVMAPGATTATTGSHFTATNTGNVNEDITIATGNSVPSGWQPGTSSDVDVYVLDFKTTGGWTNVGASPVSLAAGVAGAGTVSFDLQFTAPAVGSTYNAAGEAITVSLAATAS